MARIDQAPLEPVAARPIGTPFSDTRVTPDSQGAAVGAGLDQLAAGGGAVRSELDKIREDADHARVLQAQATALSKINDRESTFKQLRAGAAVSAATDVNAQVDGDLADAMKGLSPRQQRIYANWAVIQSVTSKKSINDHADGQLETVYDDAFKTKIGALNDRIANNFLDPVVRQTAIEDLGRTVAADVMRKTGSRGAPPASKTEASADPATAEQDFQGAQAGRTALAPDVVAQAQKSARAKGAEIVLDQMIAREMGDQAQTYFGQVRELLGAERSRQYAHDIQVVAYKQQSENAAMRVAAAVQKPGSPLLDEAKGLAAIDQMPAGTLKDQTRERFLARVQQGQSVLVQQNASLLAQAYQAFMAQPAGERSVDQIPAPLWAKITNPANLMTDKIGVFEGLQREDRAHAFSATPTPAQLQQDGLLMADMVKRPADYARKSPEMLMSENMGLVTPAQLVQIQARHTAIIGSMQGAGSIALPPKVEQLVLKLGKDSGLIHSDDPKLMTAQDAINLATVRDAIRSHEQAWKTSGEGKGKGEPPETKYLEWLNTEILQKGAVKGGGTLYGDKNNVTRAAYIATEKFQGKPFVIEDVKQIPPSDLKGINEAAARAGITLTDKARLQKYNELLQKRAQPAPPPAVIGGGLP